MQPTEKPSRTRTFVGRGVCAECSTELTLISGGLIITHGPRDARCPGGGRPPRPTEPVAEVTPTDDTTTEPGEAVEPAEAPASLPPSSYVAGDRVVRPYSGWVGDVEYVGPHHATGDTVVTVVWDHGAATTHGIDSIGQIRRVERVERPEDEPAAEVAPSPLVTQPVYTLLDEDDGAIDGGAVTPRAQTSHAYLPAEVPDHPCRHFAAAAAFAEYLNNLLSALGDPPVEWIDAGSAAADGHDHGRRIAERMPGPVPEPSLLGMAMRSRIEQLEAEASTRTPTDCEAQRRRIAVLESQLDASREEVARLLQVVRDTVAERDLLSREAAASAADARRSRDTLRGALDLIGRLGPA